MKMKRFNFGLVMLAALFSCQVQEPAEGESSAPVQNPSVLMSTAAVVEFDDTMIALIEEDLAAGRMETKSAPLNTVMEELGIVGMRRVFPDAGEGVADHTGRSFRTGGCEIQNSQFIIHNERMYGCQSFAR